MNAQNGRLGRIDDGGGHHGAEGAAVADGESSARHLFHAKFAVAGFDAVLRNFLFDVGKAHLVGVAQNGHDQTSRGSNSNTNVEIAVVHDIVAVHRGVQDRELLQSMNCRFDEETHKA